MSIGRPKVEQRGLDYSGNPAAPIDPRIGIPAGCVGVQRGRQLFMEPGLSSEHMQASHAIG
jgi:hypothetical protein